MEQSENQRSRGGCSGDLDLPENPTKSDIIRAYATVKYNVEKKLKQEIHTPQEIEDMEASLYLARDQCIAMLAELEKSPAVEYGSQGIGKEHVEEYQNPASGEDETPIPMNAVDTSEEVKLGQDNEGVATSSVECESTQCDHPTNVIDSSGPQCEDLKVKVIQDADVQREGMCGFGWICF